jgi:hypothetical protein
MMMRQTRSVAKKATRHLVGAREQRRRHGKTDRLGGEVIE